MPYLILLLVIVLTIIFGLASISQSYASAQQAQAAIEASRVAQIASTGNLVAIVTVALITVAFLIAVVLIAWLLMRTQVRVKSQTKSQWMPGPNANWGQLQQQQVSELYPTLLTMMLYQMLQSQKQQTVEPLMMDEPVDDLLAVHDDFWKM